MHWDMRKFQLDPLNDLGGDVTFGRTDGQYLPTFSESVEITNGIIWPVSRTRWCPRHTYVTSMEEFIL
jgi:hypothetical protein